MAAAPVLTLIGQTVRETRTATRPSSSFADICQMHLTFIIAIEKGRYNAPAITLVRVAAAFGVLPAELFRAFSKHVMRSVPFG